MPRSKRRRKSGTEDRERWLLTYADLITLLAAFFIVMYSMSQIDAKKFGEMAEALNGILHGGDRVIISKGSERSQTKGHGLLELGNLKSIQRFIEEKFDKLGREGELQTEITERGLVVHIMESALFRAGSAKMQPMAIEILELVYARIENIPNHIRIEGHTDDRKVTNSKYPSNWELSASRATEVVRYFIDNYGMPPDRISALGYGEYRPVRPNNSIENRSKNRRVDVVILTMELTLKEPGSQFYQLVATE